MTSPPTSPRPAGRENIQPVLGDGARLAFRMSAGWKSKRDQKVLVLLAAFSDAGERSPLARDVAARVGIEVSELDHALGSLAACGAIWTVRRWRQRNVYVLRFAGEVVPAEDCERFAAYEQIRLERPRARSADANARMSR